MGVGIVIRDHFGAVRAAMCTTQCHVIDPTIVEALVVQQGVQLCCDMGIQSILGHVAVLGTTWEGMEASLVIRIISFPLSVIGMLVLFGRMEMKLPTG
jgi:hypothetical protein